jgi:hypothetical protein
MYGQEQRIKVDIGDIDVSEYKKEIIKLLLFLKLINKNRGRLTKVNIFTNLVINEKYTCHIYIEDLSSKEVKIFDIVKKRNKKENIDKELFYSKFNIYTMKKITYILIAEENISNDIMEMEKELDKLI